MPELLEQLDYLILFNFKSFRGQVQFGPIKDFSVIAGANGAGKSNIVDALCFVMGANARSMRARRLRDLIFGASTGRPIGPRAYVTASFALDADRNLKFTRVIEKDSSEYQLNGQVVSYEEYCAQLSEFGIILNGRNCLVSQGTIESIIMKSPKELSELFEELSGSIEYKDEYNRLNDELCTLHHQMQNLVTLKRSSLASKKAYLKEKKDMDNYEMLHDQLMKLESRLQLFELYHMKKELEDCEEIEEAEIAEINQLIEEEEMISAEKKRAQKEADKLSRVLEETQKKIEDLNNIFKSKEEYYNSVGEQVVNLQAKLQNANLKVEESRAGCKAHMRTIEELEVELKEVEKMKQQFEASVAAELSSQGSSVELTNSQVSEYKRLKPISQNKALVYAGKLKALEHEQDQDQCALDNEERAKNDLKNKLKLRKTKEEAEEMRHKKLEDFITTTKNNLGAAMKRKQELIERSKECEERCIYIESKLNETQNILKDAAYNVDALKRAQKMTHTLHLLRTFCGSEKVYGRVFELCKAVHSRYQVAVVKVLGRHLNAIIVDTRDTAIRCIRHLKEQKIGIETFLPLDDLKVTPLKESLRNINIEGVKNVKLVYDIIQVASNEISNAVLFITGNTLVCETPKDACEVAWGLRSKHTCVALDGTLYRMNGTFTGGLADLERKAKVWAENDLANLEVEQSSLQDEMRNLMPKMQGMKSDINATEAEIRILGIRLKYAKSDAEQSENALAVVKNEIKRFADELNSVHITIESISSKMKERNRNIQDSMKVINSIEDRICADFCRSIGINNIRQYEQSHLIQHEEQAKTRLEFEKQRDRICNMLDYERGRDISSTLRKNEKLVETIKLELKKARQDKADAKAKLEGEKQILQEQEEKYNAIKSRFADLRKKISQYKGKLKIVSTSILSTERKHIWTLAKMEEKKAAGQLLMKNSKIIGIDIPLLPAHINPSLLDSIDKSSTDTLLFDEIQRIDFSKLPTELKSGNVSINRQQLNSEIAKMENELNLIKEPDMKIGQKLESTMKTLNDIQRKSNEILKQLNAINAEFEQVKEKRLSAFSTGFECISDQFEQIYKNLYKNTTATAMIVSENSSEPYLGGSHIHCIAPGKRWQPLNSLSGGEKTFASLALLCAFNSFVGAPFLAFDEVDASLDDVAVNNLISFIHEKKCNTRFIVVSLGKMKYRADFLFGVTSEFESTPKESVLFTFDPADFPYSPRAKE